jgi:hypothetical protein
MKYITNSSSLSTNQMYQDQSSLLTVFSTTASNIGLKITQPLQQQQSSLLSGNLNGFNDVFSNFFVLFVFLFVQQPSIVNNNKKKLVFEF